MKNKGKKRCAILMVCIMVLGTLAQTIDVVGYELGKIAQEKAYGQYFQKEMTPTNQTKVLQENTKPVFQKQAQASDDTSAYPESSEVKSRRNANSKTYQMSDGSYVQETFFEAIHKKEKGNFVDIDNTLVNTSKARSNPIYENKDGLYEFVAQNNQVSMKSEEGYTLSIRNEEANLSTYSVDGNTILYSEAYPNIDCEYRLGGDRFYQSFKVNGKSSQEAIQFYVNHEGLKLQKNEEYLTFVDEKDTVIFRYVLPTIQDELGYTIKCDIETTEISEKEVQVRIVLPQEWMNEESRVYPLSMNARAAYDPIELMVNSSYVRSHQPAETSVYYDLFVGYEYKNFSMNQDCGITRAYMHVGDLGLGSEKLVLGASLGLYKKVVDNKQMNTIIASKTNSYVDPSTTNWNNHPTNVTPISTNAIGNAEGWQYLDVTSYAQDIYAGKNNTLELRAADESSSYHANVFLNESSATTRPRLSISYRDAWDVDPALDINEMDQEMRVYTPKDKSFQALSFDGIAKPDSTVSFELMEKESKTKKGSFDSRGKSDRYFVHPIFISVPLADVQVYTKDDVNYTTDYIKEDTLPEYDTIYEYIMKVKNGTATSSKDLVSDAIVKYKVKLGDTLQSIAAYYGVKIDDLKFDNHKTNDLIKQDDILLVRMKKDNPKVSKDVYTPPIKIQEYKAKYVDRGPNCVAGVCPVLDPVNSNTGNYYYEGSDFVLKDGKDFAFKRYYNSVEPVVSGMFGNGFSSDQESFVAYDKKGNLLFFKGDGKIYEFKKQGNTFLVDEKDQLKVQVIDNKVQIEDLYSKNIYQFNSYGQLNTLVDSKGNKSQNVYDEYGLLKEMKMGNKKIQFTYNEKNLVSKITLPTGTSVSYEYDDKRNLTTFIDLSGNKEKYFYDEHQYLVYREDKNGVKTASNTYDDKGRVLSQSDGNGNETTVTYKDSTNTFSYADGSEDAFTYNEFNRATKTVYGDDKEFSYEYDEKGNITSKTDGEGNQTKYEYDDFLVTKVEYSDGSVEAYQYDTNQNMIYYKDKEGKEEKWTYVGNDVTSYTDSDQNLSTYTYDAQHRLLSETSAKGVSKSYTYDGNLVQSITHGNGLVQSFTYNANGYVVKENDNQGKNIDYIYDNKNQVIQKNYYDGTNEKWNYDGNGNLAQFQDRIGGITTNTYDQNNNLISSKKGNIANRKKYDVKNQLVEEIDEQGLSKKYTYNALQQKISESDAYGNITKFTYDYDGNLLRSEDAKGNVDENVYEGNKLIKNVDQQGLITTYEYDNRNREIKKINPNGKEETKVYDGDLLQSSSDMYGNITTYTYDAFMREIQTTITYTDGSTSITKKEYDAYDNVVLEEVDGIITRHIFDVYQREVQAIDGLGQVVSKTYDLEGRVIEEKDALGNSTKTVYDALGNELQSIDKNGNSTYKYYDANSVLLSEKDGLGFVNTYEYNSLGQPIKTIDAYRNETSYLYDAYNNVIETRINDHTVEQTQFDSYGNEIRKETPSESTSYIYDDLNRVIQQKNELTSLVVEKTYDEYGNVLVEEDSEKKKTTNVYDEYQRLSKSVDAYGRVQTQTYDVYGNVSETKAYDGTSTQSKYDAFRLLQNIDKYGNKTTYEYDVLGRKVKQSVQKGTTYEYVYDANGQIIETKDVYKNTSTKSEYDKNGNQIKTSDALGNTSTKVYDAKNQVVSEIDAKGNTTSKVYDAYGNVVKTTNALGYTTQSIYNEFNQIEQEIDERGFATTYFYDDEFQLTSIQGKRGGESTFTYDDAKQLKSETNENGNTTNYEYDVYGKEVKVISPSGKVSTKKYNTLEQVIQEQVGNQSTTYEYDSLGRLKTKKMNQVVQEENTYDKWNQVTSKKDANGNQTTYTYDSFGREKEVDDKGNKTRKHYDQNGQLIKEVQNDVLVKEYQYDANNRQIALLINGKINEEKAYDENGNVIMEKKGGLEKRTLYNALNKQSEIKIPSPQDETQFVTVQKIEYDESANIKMVEDAFGYQETRIYDADNNCISKTNQKGIEDRYEYDLVNNLVKVQNSNERYVTYAYDHENQMTYKTMNKKYASYRYDLQGNVVEESNEYGYVNRYEYDQFQRKTKHVKPDGTRINYAYDKMGNIVQEGENHFTYDARGNKTSSKNKEGSVTYTYDAFNNKTRVKDTQGKTVTYRYNENNQKVQETYAGTKVNYTYNEDGLLATVLKNGQENAVYTYNARGEVTSLKQKDTRTSKTYDEMGRVLSQQSVKDNTMLYDASYKYDPMDNLVEEKVNKKTNTYKYNDFDELVSSHKYIKDKYVDTKYEYDVYGNQVTTSSDGTSKKYQYNDKNQIKAITTNKGTIHFTYDENGNTTSKTLENGKKETYEYNAFDKMESYSTGQYTYTYKYDGEQNRIQKIQTDHKDYHYDVWYDYSVDVDVVGKDRLKDSFKELRKQIENKEKNNDVCSYVEEDKYDVTYYKEDVVTDYLLDRNQENTQILAVNDEVNIYGEGLLEENNKTILQGLNQSVVAQITKDTIQTYEYDDYGNSSKKEGHGYNSEYKDETGFIYLRARHYDPSIARFVSIDNNYQGEETEVNTQNRYVYTLNNPYKYVDRDGNKSVAESISDGLKWAINQVAPGTYKKPKKGAGAGVGIGPVGNFFDRFINPDKYPDIPKGKKGDKDNTQPNDGGLFSETSRIVICNLKKNDRTIEIYEVNEKDKETTTLALLSKDNLYADWQHKEAALKIYTILSTVYTIATFGVITVAKLLAELFTSSVDQISSDLNNAVSNDSTSLEEAIYNWLIGQHGTKFLGFYTKSVKTRLAYLSEAGITKIIDVTKINKYVAKAYTYERGLTYNDVRNKRAEKTEEFGQSRFDNAVYRTKVINTANEYRKNKQRYSYQIIYSRSGNLVESFDL